MLRLVLAMPMILPLLSPGVILAVSGPLYRSTRYVVKGLSHVQTERVRNPAL